jgi:hypothetical protein
LCAYDEQVADPVQYPVRRYFFKQELSGMFGVGSFVVHQFLMESNVILKKIS